METKQITTDEIKSISAELTVLTDMQEGFSSDAIEYLSYQSLSNIEIIRNCTICFNYDSYFISVKEGRSLIQMASIHKEMEIYHSQFGEMPPDTEGQPDFDDSYYNLTKYNHLIEGCTKTVLDLKEEMARNFLIEPYVLKRDFRKAVELQEAITTAAMLSKIYLLIQKDPTVLEDVHSRFKELARKIGRLNRRDREAKTTSK